MLSQKRRNLAILCLGAASILVAALFLYHAIFPRPARFTAVHPQVHVEPLYGFSADSVFNTGTAAQIDAFPEIGPVLSQRIVEGRSILGDYQLPTDLLLIKGIGPKTLEAILDALDEPLVPVKE